MIPLDQTDKVPHRCWYRISEQNRFCRLSTCSAFVRWHLLLISHMLDHDLASFPHTSEVRRSLIGLVPFITVSRKTSWLLHCAILRWHRVGAEHVETVWENMGKPFNGLTLVFFMFGEYAWKCKQADPALEWALEWRKHAYRRVLSGKENHDALSDQPIVMCGQEVVPAANVVGPKSNGQEAPVTCPDFL